MLCDYEARYSAILHDSDFLSWRETGARHKAANIVHVCRGINVKSAVEIGCGTGAVLRMLQSMNFAQEYTCLDIAFSAVQFVRHSPQKFVQHAVVGPASTLPFRDSVFDVAILTHLVEHLDDPASALREASRVARFVVVEVPTEKVLSNVVRTKILGRPYVSIAGAGHVQFWSQRSVVKVLEQGCGLRILERHCDLLSKDSEYYGKKGLGLAKPFFKGVLKSLLPTAVYSRLLTTHATFLCCRPEARIQLANSAIKQDRVPA